MDRVGRLKLGSFWGMLLKWLLMVFIGRLNRNESSVLIKSMMSGLGVWWSNVKCCVILL